MMRSNTRVAAVAIVAALLFTAGWARAAEPMRVQSVSGITIDGDLGDWKNVAIQPLESGTVLAAIAQDDRFLYVNFSFGDLALARRVLRSGAIVWVNATGKHEADIGLRYRGTDELQKAFEALQEAAPEPTPAPNGRARGAWSGGGGRGQRQPLGVLEVLHHAVSDTVIANGTTPDNAAAACKMVDGTFAYEFRIPFSELAAPAAGAPTGPERAIAVGIQMSGRTPAERAAASGRWRTRRQQQTKGAPPWLNAPRGSSAPEAGNPDVAGAQAPAGATGAPATAAAEAAATSTAPAGAAARQAQTDTNPPAAPNANRTRNAVPLTWFDVTVLVPGSEPAAKQE